MAGSTPNTSQTNDNTSDTQVDIDPNGDLILDVSKSEPDAKRYIKVSSKTLCLASPVFRAMLGPSSRFKAGIALATTSEERPTEMKLYGDNYNALLIIMNAMHLQTRNIPATVTVESLYEIAVVCSKYDLAERLAPWVRIWSDCYYDFEKKPGYERWFLISWVFRQNTTFKSITTRLILETGLDRNGHLATIKSGSIENGTIPDSIIKAIRHEREKLISSLISLAVAEMDRYNSHVLSRKNVCQLATGRSRAFGGKGDQVPSNKRTECDSISIGTLHRCLLKAGIWPVQKEIENRTASSIAKALRSIDWYGREIVESGGGLGQDQITHADCGPKNRIQAAIRGVMENAKELKLLDFCSKDSILFPDD